MKVVIAAGGEGVRMLPITRYLNKHLIPTGNKQLMIDSPITFLRKIGMKQLTVVTGHKFAHQVIDYVDAYSFAFDFIDYSIQPKSSGIADVLTRVPGLENDSCFLMLGDNFIEWDDSYLDIKFGEKAVCFEYDIGSKELAKSFGQAISDPDGNVVEIIEKPSSPLHSKILIGLYYFPQCVLQRVKSLSPSKRNELEITDLLASYLKDNMLEIRQIKTKWFDLGEWHSLAQYQEWSKI